MYNSDQNAIYFVQIMLKYCWIWLGCDPQTPFLGSYFSSRAFTIMPGLPRKLLLYVQDVAMSE